MGGPRRDSEADTAPLVSSGEQTKYFAVGSQRDGSRPRRRPRLSTLTTSIGEVIQLKRTLTLFNGVALVLGVIVGSGIFVSPKGVLQQSGSIGLSLVIWAISGFIALLGALCFAELGTCIGRSGGQFAYIKELGPLPAFLYLWSALFISFPATNAVTSLTFAYYVIQPFFPDCPLPDRAVTLLAAVALCLLTFINCVSVTWATKVQDIFAIIKCLALLMIIVTGIVLICMGRTDNLKNAFDGPPTDAAKIALALYSGLFSLSGWDTLNFLIEELKDPFRNLPLAICIAMPLVTLIYVLTNIAYFTVLTPEELLASDAVAVTFAMRVYGSMAWIMPVFVAFSAFGSLNGILLSVSRVYFVGAQEGQLPSVLGLISYKLITPFPSVLFQGIISCLFLVTSNVYLLINYVALLEGIGFAASVVVLLRLRWTQPHIQRPIKVNILIPIIFLLASIFLIIFPFFHSPVEMLIAILICVSGIPFYLVGVAWKSKPRCLQVFMDMITRFTQILVLGVHEIR